MLLMPDDEQKITEYVPDNTLKNGYINIMSEISKEISQNRWLIWQLFKRDFLAVYKQSFLGILWAIIIPLLSVGTFIVLNRSGILDTGDIKLPYPVFAIAGMAFWQVFAVGIVAGANSLVKAGPMIIKINFSRKSLVISSTGQALIVVLILFVLLALMFLYYKTLPPPSFLLAPLFLIPIILLSLGLSFILSLLNGIARDFGNGISAVVNFLVFLTPVLYIKPETGILAVMTKYNPLYYLVSIPRDYILTGSFSDVNGYIISCVFAVAVFFVCIISFHITESKIAERI